MSVGALSQDEYGSLIGALPVLSKLNPGFASSLAKGMGVPAPAPMPLAPKPQQPYPMQAPSAAKPVFVGPKGSNPQDAIKFNRDWFLKDAAIQRKLSFKFWKSGYANQASDIFTASGATQFITLNPNAAKSAAAGLNAVDTDAVITNINLESDFQNLRKFLYFEGFSWNMRWRNGTGAGLDLSPQLVEEFLAQGNFQFYNDGSQLEDKILLSEVETPQARRIYAATYPATADTNNAVQRGDFSVGSYYRFPRYMVVHPRAPFGLLLTGVPAAMVAAVNATFPTVNPVTPAAGEDSNFELEVILHESTQKLPD